MIIIIIIEEDRKGRLRVSFVAPFRVSVILLCYNHKISNTSCSNRLKVYIRFTTKSEEVTRIIRIYFGPASVISSTQPFKPSHPTIASTHSIQTLHACSSLATNIRTWGHTKDRINQSMSASKKSHRVINLRVV